MRTPALAVFSNTKLGIAGQRPTRKRHVNKILTLHHPYKGYFLQKISALWLVNQIVSTNFAP
jgi:hypothetical protein